MERELLWCAFCGKRTPHLFLMCQEHRASHQIALTSGKEGGENEGSRTLQLVPEDPQDPQGTSSIHLTPLSVKGVKHLAS
jgi:hypothetical protein